MQKPSTTAPPPKQLPLSPPIGRFVGLVAVAKEKYAVVVFEEDADGKRITRRVVESSLSLGPAMSAALVEFGKLKDGASKLWQALK